MNPFTFLSEECNSVREALNETLRHDYGPQRSLDYFNECKTRLDSIRAAIDDEPGMDSAAIAAHMRSLSALGSRISLIERSHLGEFSWPFAETIREIAEALFSEKSFDDSVQARTAPIVNVIAEGMQYQIVDDALPLIGDQRIIVVAFPRQLKHHVLLHSIFGHELGHTAFNSDGPGLIITSQVIPTLIDKTPLSDTTQATEWLKRKDAPPTLKAALELQPNYKFPDTALTNWRIELVCDLFGLLLFGPAFAAAHRTILEPLCANPSDFDLASSTHPPYCIRRRVIITAIKILGWDRLVTKPEDGVAHEAEKAFFQYICEDADDQWSSLLTQDQLTTVVARLSKVFEPYPNIAFKPPNRTHMVELVSRLTLGRPPIIEEVDNDGKAKHASIPTCHCLYAGWTFWFGREKAYVEMVKNIPMLRKLTFLEINRLCNYAILQQRAIDPVLKQRAADAAREKSGK